MVPVGVLELDAYSGSVRHAYRLREADTPSHTLCGRRAFAGTSRGQVWHDRGPLRTPGQVGCGACLEELRRLGYP
jgi:hypothetical protein